MGDDFEVQPPAGYVDADPHDLLLDAQRQARAILPTLPMSQLNALLDLLAPAVKKLRWYEGRYNTMLASNQSLTADNKKLFEKLRAAESRQK